MKLTKKQLYKIFYDLKPQKNMYPDIKIVLEVVAETLNINPDEKLKLTLKNHLQLFKKIVQNKKVSFEEKLTKLECLVVLDSQNFSAKSPEPENRKTFVDAGRETRLTRTQQLVDALESFVKKDGNISIPQLLGYLLYRTQYMSDRKLSDLGSKLFDETYSRNEFSLDEAIAVMHSLVLSKEQLRLMKNMLKSKHIYFPNTNELLEARKRLKSTISSTPDSRGVMVDYKSLVKQTVEAHVIQIEKEYGMNLSCTDKIEIGLKDGCDGAGSQSVMKSLSAIGSAPNMFVYGIVPLYIKVNDLEESCTKFSRMSPSCLSSA